MGLLSDKKGLIMGVANERSIAWGIAKACSSQGAKLAFTYQGEALKKRIIPLAESVGSDLTLECDVADQIANLIRAGDLVLVKGSLGTNMAPIIAAINSKGLENINCSESNGGNE